MVSVAFDTLKFANRLKAAGVPDKQAEAEAEALAEVLEVNLRSLATKEDLERFKIDLQRDLHELEQRMIIKLGALMAVAVGAVATLIKRL
jgi:hypothetical protein